MNISNEFTLKDMRREHWPEILEVSAREVFQIMLNSELEPLNIDSEPILLECTAMVGLAGRLCGVFTFRCHPGSAVLVASKMLGIEVPDSDEQALDAIGEVCNMIAGNFKNKISGCEPCVLSAPTVVVGGDYRVHSLVAHSLQKVFQFEGAPVAVALELRA